jgi:hypothetical protein
VNEKLEMKYAKKKQIFEAAKKAKENQFQTRYESKV